MGLMHRFMYKFAAFIAIIAFMTAMLNGVSISTSLFRSGLIFLGTLLVFILALNLMRWSIVSTTVLQNYEIAKEAAEAKEKEKKQKSSRDSAEKLTDEKQEELIDTGR